MRTGKEELKMNTSEAKLLLFLGSSYSVNQKRKPKKKKKEKFPQREVLKALQIQVAEVGWAVKDLGLLHSGNSLHCFWSPEELPMVGGGDKQPSLISGSPGSSYIYPCINPTIYPPVHHSATYLSTHLAICKCTYLPI